MDLRITPACAGTTSSRAAFRRFSEDHPRVCGNHLKKLPSAQPEPGSPPRVREPQAPATTMIGGLRITPACAGTTTNKPQDPETNKDHPRVCGNHLCPLPLQKHRPGSPPRVREPRQTGGFQLSLHRITPACAGTTCDAHLSSADSRDHPRVCGNH